MALRLRWLVAVASICVALSVTTEAHAACLEGSDCTDPSPYIGGFFAVAANAVFLTADLVYAAKWESAELGWVIGQLVVGTLDLAGGVGAITVAATKVNTSDPPIELWAVGPALALGGIWFIAHGIWSIVDRAHTRAPVTPTMSFTTNGALIGIAGNL